MKGGAARVERAAHLLELADGSLAAGRDRLVGAWRCMAPGWHCMERDAYSLEAAWYSLEAAWYSLAGAAYPLAGAAYSLERTYCWLARVSSPLRDTW